jgi:hypothetical protein
MSAPRQLQSDINSLINDHKDRQGLMQENIESAHTMLCEENLEEEQEQQLSQMLCDLGKMKEQAAQQAKILDDIKCFMDMNDEQKVKGYSDLQKAFGEIQTHSK